MPQQGRKVKKRSPLFAPVSFLLICVALIFGISVFFRVYSVTVTGNEKYTAEEIIEASGIEQGDNLFFINGSKASSRIEARLPYIETARLRRSLPNRLVIQVTESDAVAYVQTDGGYWILDRSCKLLSQATAESMQGLIRIDGLSAIAPSVGGILSPGEADSPKVLYLSAILRQLTGLGMTDSVTWIDMSNLACPVFDYLGRFTVKLGSSEELDYKFQRLRSAVAQLQEGDRGTLDLSIDKRVHLTYE